MKLQLVSIEKQGFIRVAADGSITASDFTVDGKNPLADALGETWANNNVLISFEKVNFIDSTAIGWLISSNKQFRDAGGKMVIHTLQPSVRQVLDLLKVGKTVSIAENEPAARALVSTAG